MFPRDLDIDDFHTVSNERHFFLQHHELKNPLGGEEKLTEENRR